MSAAEHSRPRSLTAEQTDGASGIRPDKAVLLGIAGAQTACVGPSECIGALPKVRSAVPIQSGVCCMEAVLGLRVQLCV